MAAGGDLFIHLGLVVIAAALLAFLFRLIKQPQLFAYILVGIFITPVFQLITDTTIIESMSTIGIAFLLFIVGIEIDFKRLKDVALISSLGGVVQISILSTSAYLLALLFNFLSIEAMYIGLMFAFSSTMMVMKFLSDRKELNTLHGRIILGFLIVEDIFAIFVLSILTSIDHFSAAFLGVAFLKFLSLFVLAYICSRFIFPVAFEFAAKNQELLLISSLGVCFLFSLIFHFMGFSLAIGAFIAGVTLGNLSYNLEIIGKIKSLRDFFALLFFVSLGMGLSLSVLETMMIPFLVFGFFIMIIKPTIVTLVCTIFKYTKKPSFTTGIYLSQIGEFSLIIAAQGLLVGHLSQDVFSFIVLLTLISMVLTSYLINYQEGLFKFLDKPLLSKLEVFNTEGLEFFQGDSKPSIVLCGHNRIGYSILRSLKKVKKKVLVVDYNPEIITKLAKQGYHCIYGEAGDEEIIERMHLKNIKIFISTIPSFSENTMLIKRIKRVNKKAKIFVTADNIEDALKFYSLGVDYVNLPHFLGGEKVADLITSLRRRKTNLKNERFDHIEDLKGRKDFGHEHPSSLF